MSSDRVQVRASVKPKGYCRRCRRNKATSDVEHERPQLARFVSSSVLAKQVNFEMKLKLIGNLGAARPICCRERGLYIGPRDQSMHNANNIICITRPLEILSIEYQEKVVDSNLK